MSTLDQEVVTEVKPCACRPERRGRIRSARCVRQPREPAAGASLCPRKRELAVRVLSVPHGPHIVSQLAAEGLLVGAIGTVVGLLIANCVSTACFCPRPSSTGSDRGRWSRGPVRGRHCPRVCHRRQSCPGLAGNENGYDHCAQAGSARRGAPAPCADSLAAGRLALLARAPHQCRLDGPAFVSLRSVPLGFDPDRALTMSISLHGQRFNRGVGGGARELRREFYQQLIGAIRRVPGVEQVGSARCRSRQDDGAALCDRSG